MNCVAAHPHGRGAGAGGGFTLVELLVSIAMVAVLSVAMGSAVLIASRAIDNGGGGSSRSVLAADLVAQIRSELRLATRIPERSGRTVRFTVPDRNGDGVEERIAYSWNGIAGTPLMRAYNDTEPEVVAEDVRVFDLDFLVQSIAATDRGGQESGEVLLASHEDAPGGRLRTFDVGWEDWCAQYFRPALPANAVSWSVTRVEVMARRDRTPIDGEINVYIVSADAALNPAMPILGEARVSETSLPSSMGWIDVPFTQIAGIDPSAGLCVVFAYRSGSGDIGVFQYEEGGNPMTPDSHWMTSGNRGYTFTSPEARRDMLFRMHGTVTTSSSSGGGS